MTNALCDRLDACLPQTQCTRCGYPRCRDYAAALAERRADIDQCPPGGDATIVRLAQLLGVAIKPLNPRFGPVRARVRAVIDERLCIGCRKCLDVCPTDAIVGAAKLMHTVLAADCTGCELCLPPCPVDCIALIPVFTRHARGAFGSPPDEPSRAPSALGSDHTKSRAARSAPSEKNRAQRATARPRTNQVARQARSARPLLPPGEGMGMRALTLCPLPKGEGKSVRISISVGEGMRVRVPSPSGRRDGDEDPHPLPSPKGRGEVGENLYFGWRGNEGEGWPDYTLTETARWRARNERRVRRHADSAAPKVPAPNAADPDFRPTPGEMRAEIQAAIERVRRRRASAT